MANQSAVDKIALELEIRGAQQAIGNVSALANSFDSAHAKAQAFSNIAIRMGANLTNFAGASIRAAANLERQRVTLESLTKSTQRAKDLLRYFDTRASISLFNRTELTQAGKQLTAFGLQAEKYLPMIDDLAAATENSLSDVARAVGRIKSGDFGEAFERLRDFGISRKDLEGEGLKFDRSGSYKGSVEDALTAIEKIINRKFSGLSQKIATSTFTGAMSSFKDEWERFLAGEGNRGLDKLTGGIKFGTKALKGAAQEMGPLGALPLLLGGASSLLTPGLLAYNVLQTRGINQGIRGGGPGVGIGPGGYLGKYFGQAGGPTQTAAAVGNVSAFSGKLGTAVTLLGSFAAALGIATLGLAALGALKETAGIKENSNADYWATTAGYGAIGAGIGSVVPVIGTIFGGALGSFVGGIKQTIDQILISKSDEEKQKDNEAFDLKVKNAGSREERLRLIRERLGESETPREKNAREDREKARLNQGSTALSPEDIAKSLRGLRFTGDDLRKFIVGGGAMSGAYANSPILWGGQRAGQFKTIKVDISGVGDKDLKRFLEGLMSEVLLHGQKQGILR